MQHRMVFLLPLLLLLILSGHFFWGLGSEREPAGQLVREPDKPIPDFSLVLLGADPEARLTAAELREGGGLYFVNFFASWCLPCRAEHAQITRLSEIEGLSVIGIAYRDKPEDTEAFLTELGNPYTIIGLDEKGEVGFDWGITGVPESFLVDGKGHIRRRHVGPLLPEHLENRILPDIRRLQ